MKKALDEIIRVMGRTHGIDISPYDKLCLMKSLNKRLATPDDEQNICVILTKFLRSSGYSCESATDPTKTLEVLKRNGFELVISDIKMAGFVAEPFQLPELKAKMERIDLERKMQRVLRELNTTLEVLLKRAEKDKETLSENVVSSVKELLLPYLEKLKKEHNSRPDSI
jgi:CheY-like chemotaxis protein